MYKNIADSIALVKELVPLVAQVANREIVVCPSYTALAAVKPLIAGSNIKLGAQNLNWESQGAFTGEI